MDPLTAIYLAGTVVQFVDFSCKLISVGHRLYAHSQLDVHAQAARAADDIRDYTIRLRQSFHVSADAILTDEEVLLESICEGCDELAKDLHERLEKLEVPHVQDGVKLIWPTLLIAFQSIWKKEDLLAIQQRLEEYRRQVDSRVILGLSTQISVKFLEQSKRLDRLDIANKEIAVALVNDMASDGEGLKAQTAALSTLLARAELVVAAQENSHQRHKSLASQILKSLNFDTIKKRFEDVDESYDTTFAWIFRPIQKTAQYAEGTRWGDLSQWLEFGTGLYWINGKAASGKPTLMNYIIEKRQTSVMLNRWAGESELCTGVFFFRNSGSKQQCSQAGLLRSLLFEILGKFPQLILGESWSLSTLILAFEALISQTTVALKLCLFIDGLDEYEEIDAEIAELFGKTCLSDNVKICCSSRPHQAFEDAFASHMGLRLQDLTINDMRLYVHRKLEKNTRMQQLSQEEPQATKELVEEIQTAASGVVLWVRLVVASLLNGLGDYNGIHYLQMRLRQLPPELDDLYHYMVFRVDNVYQQEKAQLLQLVGTGWRGQSEPISWRDQIGDKFCWHETPQLSILLLSFASERDPTLAETAKPGFLTKSGIMNRCQDMEICLGTRCGGLLEVHYGTQSSVSSDMMVTYLHRTVKDYLELREIREKLVDISDGSKKDLFKSNYAIFKAHLLVLKAIDHTAIPVGALIRDAITWARRTENDMQESHSELIDGFFVAAQQLWSKRSLDPQLKFFLQHESMLTLAAQCGLHHYLNDNLHQNNEIEHWQHQRSLLDYAICPQNETEAFINVDVVHTLLEHGANPNIREGDSQTSPWQNALCYLTAVLPYMDRGKQKEYIVGRWISIVAILLKSGADPHAGCFMPESQVKVGQRKFIALEVQLLTQIFDRAFGSEPLKLAKLRKLLFDTRQEARRSKSSKRWEYKFKASCTSQ